MPSLFSDAYKASINTALDNIHDSFKQEVYVYVEEPEALKPSLDFNPLYKRTVSEAEGVAEKVLVKHTIWARVNYPSKQVEGVEDFTASANIPASKGIVRLKVTTEDYELLKQAAKVEIDEVIWAMDSDAKVIKPFGARYYEVFLKRDN